jgi:NitT/TauT family transport system substrate-binding protein
MTPKKFLLFFILLSIGLLIVSCQRAPAAEEGNIDRIILRVQRSPFISNAPIYIAEAEGFFEEQGLEIEFIDSDRGPEAIPLLVTGKIDVLAATADASIINTIVREQNIRVVADRGNNDPEGCTYNALIVSNYYLASGEIDDPGDLVGKTVRSSETGVTAFLLDSVLQEYGAGIQDVQIVNLRQAGIGSALGDGTLHAAVMAEPFVTMLEQSGEGVVWYRGEEVNPYYAFGVIAFGPSILEDNPEAGKRFMVAYLKGVRQYNEGKTERNLEIFHEYTQLDYEILESMCLPSISSDGSINFEEGMIPFLEWSLTSGFIDAMITEGQYYDPSFIEYANQSLAENP